MTARTRLFSAVAFTLLLGICCHDGVQAEELPSAITADLQSARDPFLGDPFGRLTRGSRFDVHRFPYSRRVVQSLTGFPNLHEFEVMDPYQGKRYNCIAHSLGIHSRWVNPATGPTNRPLSLMDRLYKIKGYTRASRLDFSRSQRFQKVAVYAHVANGQIRQVTHAAIQELDGTWSSKLGQLPLIRHREPNSVSGNSYGQPVAVYFRARTRAAEVADLPMNDAELDALFPRPTELFDATK